MVPVRTVWWRDRGVRLILPLAGLAIALLLAITSNLSPPVLVRPATFGQTALTTIYYAEQFTGTIKSAPLAGGTTTTLVVPSAAKRAITSSIVGSEKLIAAATW